MTLWSKTRAGWGDQVGCCRIQNQPLLQYAPAKEPSKWIKWRRSCFFKSFVCNQARKIWMLRQVLWLSLSTSFPSEVCVFQYQITTPAAHWKPRLLHVPNQHGQDSSCPPVLSDARPYWPRKHDVQGTFKAKSLHEPTTWTSYPCDIEILSKTRWSEPELGKLLRWACRDGSSFLNLHGNSTVFSASDLAAFEALIFSISLDLWYLCTKSFIFFAAHWLPSIWYWYHSCGFIWQAIIWRTFEVKRWWTVTCIWY